VLAGPGEDDLVHAVRGFDRFANPALLVTVLTGAFQAWRLDRDDFFGSSHGRVVGLKIVVVIAIVLAGVATRQFVRARLAHAEEMTAPLASRLRRATGMQAAGGVVVLMLSSWLVAITPPASATSGGTSVDYGYTQGGIVAGDLDINVLLSGVVGRNAVRVEVVSPPAGLSNVTIRFVPPVASTASEVVLTLPATMTGAGAAVLDLDDGIPLEAPGVWTLIISATTPTGPHSGQKTFTVLE
jgi:copper transport protein